MPATLTEQARDYIFNKLVRGELEPGQRLSNRQLAKEMGISFIPVREAIHQLASEGLIMHRPKLGAFVAIPNRQELAELYDLREALECHAVGSAAIRQADIDEMQRQNDVIGDIARSLAQATDADAISELNDRYAMTDAALHLTLLRAAGNTRAIKVLRDLRIMTRIFGHRRRHRPTHLIERAHRQHENIIEALRQKDSERARQLMTEHIRHGCETALELFDRVRAQNFASQGGAPSDAEYAPDLQQRVQDMEQL
ncbi:MAG: GntR family transcriptional regulator [Phycisphaeraceae bacterium]|nr:GntR family transcriptional regulator [Phycisphaeraceae bacterium]